jgi:hypothetical protein
MINYAKESGKAIQKTNCTPPPPQKKNRGGKYDDDVTKRLCVCKSMCTHTCKQQLMMMMMMMITRGEKEIYGKLVTQNSKSYYKCCDMEIPLWQ